MKKVLSFILMLSLMLSLTISVFAVSIEYKDKDGKVEKLSDFRDTNGHWAHDTILKWAEYGLVAGNNGNFMPNKNIKRGDLAIILDRMLGLKTTTYNFFTDLPNDSYYRDAILRCVAAGYINGTTSNTVSPEGFATREQVAVIICRIFDIDTSYSGSTGFADDYDIGVWSKPSIYAMKRLGYMNGTSDNKAKPKSNITRAELVTMLNNIASTYIPKKDTTSEGTSFSGKYPTNVVTSRNIELNNATIGRDLILTQATSSISLTNTEVRGRILALGKNSMTLSNSEISQIILLDGKSTLTGVSEKIKEVYVGQYASESSLDKIPNKVVLESGVRIKIDGTMYENTSAKTKTYYGSDLKAAIANEQGYVIGGPKVSNVKFTQDQDNTITVSDIKITVGDSSVKEVGVIWLDQNENEDTINPTYQNYDGKKVYDSDKINEPFGFTVGKVNGLRAYRVYVKDKDGLFAYSNTSVFSEYEFSTSLKIYDNNYPEKVDVEVIMKGDKIPDINSVRIVYDITELYSENHKEINLKLYSDPDAEEQPDTTKYKRYIGTITSDKIKNSLNEYEYAPPTAFGYIITFKNGTIINRFPVLVNAVPDNISPMASLVTGSASYNGNNIFIKDNKVITRYAIPQEVGVVYKVSDSESVSRPVAEANGWTRSSASINVGINETGYFSNTIPLSYNTGYTYYAAYVKTSNGYWYGDVQRINNGIQGDENGPRILGNPQIIMLSETSGLVVLNITNLNDDININSPFVVSGDDYFLNKSLSGLEYVITNTEDKNTKKLIVQFNNLTANKNYNLGVQVVDNEGLKSNVQMIGLNTNNVLSISLSDKILTSTGWTKYLVNFGSNSCYINSAGHSLVNMTDGRLSGETDMGKSYISVNGISDLANAKISISCYYREGSHNFMFTRVINLY